MKRPLASVLVAGAIMGAFLLGRATHEFPAERDAAESPSGDGPVAERPEGSAASAGIDPAIHPARDARAMRPGAPPTSFVAAKTARSGSGPRPLSADGEQRLRALAERMVRLGEREGELYELAENEPPGPDSALLEDLIATTIRRHGGAYTKLEIARPRCTQSVCMLMATGPSNDPDPGSDFQQLSSVILNQPWFRQYFDDYRAMVRGDEKGTLYLSYYIRCPRNACLYAK